ncbi:MAG: coenzyme F420-0:L-glutamate ligase [Clostridia bacterium]|nr:coenzyme F420-0:L-glutamate ligase [Clostridia bacterium]
MEFVSNEGKNVEISVGKDIYLRHAIKMRFITDKDNYIDVIKEYVSDIYEEGDIISISEKIISICQNKIIKREDIKIGFWAKFLSKFACRKNRGGYGVGMAINMQYAINKVGILKVIFASLVSGITKLIGIKGVFYKIVGRDVSGLDGFYDGAWNEYKDIGIELPENSKLVCNEIKNKLGISAMIVDSNDFGQVILGKSNDIKLSDKILREIIRDNPAGQGKQTTPIILIRKKV